MIFKSEKHNPDLYNILLTLSRNIFFYNKIKLPDNFETRIYLMFMHFSILMIVSKNKGLKFSQKSYDLLFHNIENNLREAGLGDVAVNKKMKELNKILYDILLKIKSDNINKNTFKTNHSLIIKYFEELKDPKSSQFEDFDSYFINFFKYCFELPHNYMIKELINFKY